MKVSFNSGSVIKSISIASALAFSALSFADYYSTNMGSNQPINPNMGGYYQSQGSNMGGYYQQDSGDMGYYQTQNPNMGGYYQNPNSNVGGTNQPRMDSGYYQNPNMSNQYRSGETGYYQNANPNQNMGGSNVQYRGDSGYYQNPNMGGYYQSARDNQNRSMSSGTYGNAMQDQDLAKKVHDKITSGWFSKNYDKVTVQASNGVVTLGGTVKTMDDKNKVEKEVQNIEGVKSVNNQVAVQEK